MDKSSAIISFRKYLEKFLIIKNDEFETGAKFFDVQYLKKGETFVHEGKVSRYLGFIAKGFMRSFILNDGKEITTCLCNEDNIASSSTSLGVIAGLNLIMKRRAIFLYVFLIFVGAVLMGYLYDLYFVLF
jgi:hypothetical protein